MTGSSVKARIAERVSDGQYRFHDAVDGLWTYYKVALD
jgi:hypothetical protein